MSSKSSKAPHIQGEGDYEAARRYQQRTEKFIADHDTESAARHAAPRNSKEAIQMAEAEARGRAKARNGNAGARH